MTIIEKIIAEYAALRNVEVAVIHEEIKNEDEATMNQLFLLSCAFKAVA